MSNLAHLPSRNSVTLVTAADRFLDSLADDTKTAKTYAATFERLAADVGEDTELAMLDAETIEYHLRDRYGDKSASYYNRNRAAISSLFQYALKRRWLTHNPTLLVDRRQQRKGPSRALPFAMVEKAWTDPDVALRERCLWAMLYETAARAEEVLQLNVEDCDLGERSAVIVGKGGDREEVFWATTTARLLDRYLEGRATGPVFVGTRLPQQPQPARDTAPDGRARLSYRRAAELFTEQTGWTLHQLRHSALTHLAEAGVDVTLLKAKSRHASLRSLEVYVSPSRDAVKRLTDANDPLSRRR